MSAIDELARRLQRVEKKLAKRPPQLANASFEDGSIGEYRSVAGGEPQLVARYGLQFDGGHGPVVFAGPTPPTPAGASAVPISTGIKVVWDGTWEPVAIDPNLAPTPGFAPTNLQRVEVHVGADPEMSGVLFTTYRGSFESPRGGEHVVLGLAQGVDYYVRLTARTTSGGYGQASAVIGPFRAGKLAEAELAVDLSTIGGNAILRGATEPVGTHKIGDLWLRTTDNVPHRWEGDPADWVESRDAGIAEAMAVAFAAEEAAATKAELFVQPAEPGPLAAGEKGIWLDSDNGHRYHTWDGAAWVSKLLGNASIEPNSLVASDVVATGTVTAALLEAVMLLASRIVAAGPDGENGDHIELAPTTGLRSFAVNPDGVPVVTSRFGGNGADRLGITDPTTGATLASINEEGFLSVAGASVKGSLYVGGNSLTYLLDQLPKGEIARAGVEASLPETSSALGAYDVEFTAIPGRSYKLSTTPLNIYPTTTATYYYATLTVRPSADGPPSLASGKPVVAARGTSAIAGGANSLTLHKNVSFNELFANNTPPNGQVPTAVRVLLVYGVVSGGGSVGIFSTPSYPAHTIIEDAGTSKPFTGVMNNGGGSTATPVRETTLDLGTTWTRSYNGANSAERDVNSLVQGYTPYYASAGSAISLLGFPDMTATLAGATINWAALYLEATHWHNDTGGQILLGAHGWLSDTGATKPGSGLFGNQLQQTFSGKSGGIWVYLPSSWFAGIKSGATRGFMLGDGASTSNLYYGRFVKAGTLRINYTK